MTMLMGTQPLCANAACRVSSLLRGRILVLDSSSIDVLRLRLSNAASSLGWMPITYQSPKVLLILRDQAIKKTQISSFHSDSVIENSETDNESVSTLLWRVGTCSA